MPEGKSLQLGSIHHYRENFSRPFEVKYEDKDGSMKYVHQTTFGMSERLVGAVVGVHGDDKGLILPPDIAPFQVVLIPILAKGKIDEVMASAKELEAELVAVGVRVKLDDKDERPGSKFYNWEIKGVPLRLELGARDIGEGKVCYAIRETGIKGAFLRTEVAVKVQELLLSIAKEMNDRAVEKMRATIIDISSIENLPAKTVRFGWCGCEECGHAFEQKTELKLLGTPYTKEEFHGKCIVCGKETDVVAYAARSM